MTKIIIFTSLLCLFSCTSSDRQQETNVAIKDTTLISSNHIDKKPVIVDSILTDNRDQQQYKIKRFEDLWWMIENLNYNIGDSLFYRDTYIGMAGYCLDNNPENCKKYGRLYDFPAAIKACPKGWRIPNLEEWLELDKKYANCTWNKASTTGNYRDSLPSYKPVAGSNAIYQSQYKRLYFYPKHSIARYWAMDKQKSTSAIIYEIDTEICKTTSVIVGSTKSILAQKRFYSCRCVQEAK